VARPDRERPNDQGSMPRQVEEAPLGPQLAQAAKASTRARHPISQLAHQHCVADHEFRVKPSCVFQWQLGTVAVRERRLPLRLGDVAHRVRLSSPGRRTR
jgi:hypothetical protein